MPIDPALLSAPIIGRTIRYGDREAVVTSVVRQRPPSDDVVLMVDDGSTGARASAAELVDGPSPGDDQNSAEFQARERELAATRRGVMIALAKLDGLDSLEIHALFEVALAAERFGGMSRHVSVAVAVGLRELVLTGDGDRPENITGGTTDADGNPTAE